MALFFAAYEDVIRFDAGGEGGICCLRDTMHCVTYTKQVANNAKNATNSAAHCTILHDEDLLGRGMVGR